MNYGGKLLIDRDTHLQSTTKDLGFIRAASKWNCPFVRASGKGFVNDTVTSTSSSIFTCFGDAWTRRERSVT